MTPTQKPASLLKILASLMLQKVPTYANKIYYSLGFLSMTSFFILIISGLVLVFFGPSWWLVSPLGLYFRSIHLWAGQAFVFFIFLHLLIVFLTSGYKPPRRLTWVIGAIMMFLVFMEAEFGYGLRGDFSSQWRVLQASDLYNGSGLGRVVNNLNYGQIYGIHIALIPLGILGLLFLHYLLIKVRGIAKPYKPEVKYTIVKANHFLLFLRGAVLIAVILILAKIFPSPLILPTTISGVAKDDPSLVAGTLLKEFAQTSDTSTYSDNINPYTYNTAQVYVINPYIQLLQTQNSANVLAAYNSHDMVTRQNELQSATDYFNSNGRLKSDDQNPLIAAASALTKMAQSDLYESALQQQSASGIDGTFAARFLADTGILDIKAQDLKMTTGQYGMLREEKGLLPPGAWWLAPLGLLDHTILANDDNQDRDGAEILAFLVLLLMAFPYIPYLNRLPEKIGLDKFIWKE